MQNVKILLITFPLYPYKHINISYNYPVSNCVQFVSFPHIGKLSPINITRTIIVQSCVALGLVYSLLCYGQACCRVMSPFYFLSYPLER